jgi:hypothetical protein
MLKKSMMLGLMLLALNTISLSAMQDDQSATQKDSIFISKETVVIVGMPLVMSTWINFISVYKKLNGLPMADGSVQPVSMKDFYASVGKNTVFTVGLIHCFYILSKLAPQIILPYTKLF